MSGFPTVRMRRLRASENVRRMVRENAVRVDDLIYPLFVVPGSNVKKEIASMPGCFHFSVDQIVEECKRVRDLGIPGVLLFGIPERKDACGSEAYAADGIVQRAVAAIAAEINKNSSALEIITDVCLCEYTDHGHCGPLCGEGGDVDNDVTLPLIAQTALSHARAGATMVAPSDMMDGRIAAIRTILDQAGFTATPIMAYSAKYASAFYGPFRDAADSAPASGDRRGYQMDPGNAREALEEVRLDIEEGADIVMVKPALPYLDIIAKIRERFDRPIAAYNVSGEYAMVKAAAEKGWIDEKRAAMESLLAIKRAGADIVITYFAKQAAEWLAG